jgi:Heterokaryon incompatibility protein (HET)
MQLRVKYDDEDADAEELELGRYAPLYSPWLDISTTSPANLILARIWLRNCLKNHKPCNSGPESGPLPRRVIDVTNPQAPFLRLGNGQHSRYVTLSYKWGDSRKYTTSCKNFLQHLREISFRMLPWTFRDAVQVTNGLGFRYLWIDALCIIQDLKDDLQEEIGSMDKIYRNSTLTLFAAGGDNANAGLSVSRDPRWVKPCKVNLKTTAGHQRSEGSLYVTLSGADNEDSPLYERGWVLQEQILSTRGLVFGRWEMSWRCICVEASEKSPDYCSGQEIEEVRTSDFHQWQVSPSHNDGVHRLRLWFQEKDHMPKRAHRWRINQFDQWYSMVSHYTIRSLKYRCDVLPALSGLASAMAQTHGCTYVARLWKEGLQTGLAWYVQHHEYHLGQPSVANTDQESLHVPTWSWASCWGKNVAFRGWESNATHVVQEGLVFVSGGDHRTASSVDTFAGAVNRRLTVAGRLKRAILQKPDSYGRRNHNNKILEKARWLAFVEDPETGDKLGQVALDSHPATVSFDGIFCLLCVVRWKFFKWQLTCLGLVPTDTSGKEYRRVGLVFLEEQDWFGKLSEDFLDRKRVRRAGNGLLPTVTII